MPDPVILWLRRDLRLSDQPALRAAVAAGPVIPVYILDDERAADHAMGGASRWWLHHSLASLSADLEEKGSQLILRKGDSVSVLCAIAAQQGASQIHALRHYEPWWVEAESELKAQLDADCALCLHDGNYLKPPGSVTTGSDEPYKIYTPFWKSLKETMPPEEAIRAPQKIESPDQWPDSDRLNDWALLPTDPDWATAFTEMWTPGEEAARRQVNDFRPSAAAYDDRRNLPSEDGSSRLSPHLHFGEVSPSYVWHRIAEAKGDATVFLKELAWRDYAQNVIMQFPDYGVQGYRERFEELEWRDFRSSTVRDEFDRWCHGRTGYPIVDAGMRQLWKHGWLHNRVRMICASFLIKHLLIDWREGERWYWDCLVDADYGNNAVNWQWISGTGVDSNMFVRIMAPLSQSEKFDAADYIRRYVPELADLPDDAIHDPEDAGCKPDDYPAKIIGHKDARERALAAYEKIKN
ncbi:MAG: deoxyribodipyrimidine photo-lyase [Novosphingopyxis baekryungensis]|nr:deoxyribodipyrimidine photo-lyase [Novosphingopyxis baekryungensis]